MKATHLSVSLLCLATTCFAATPLPLQPHLGEWKQSGDSWQTGGSAPSCGWYLRSPKQYDLQELNFKVEPEKDGGYVFVYFKDWRLEFSKDQLTARYTGFWGPGKPPYRLWTKYFYTASRPIAFTPGTQHDVSITLDGQLLKVKLDGKEVLAWGSPKEEWLEKVKKSGRMRFLENYVFPEKLDADALAGKNQIIVLHAYETPAKFSGVSFVGKETGDAEGFVQIGEPPAPSYAKPDTDFARLVPDAPVAPANALEQSEKERAASLPAVESWSFIGEKNSELVDPSKYFGEENGRPVKVADYLIGAKEPGKIPSALHRFWRSKRWGANNMPQETRLYFNLQKEGDYTLKLESGYGMGWGGNELEIRVDGTPVSREVYRAISQGGHCAPISHWVPLKLAAGPHRIDIDLTETLVKQRHFNMEHGRFPIHGVSLTPGIQQPEMKRFVGKPTVEGESPEALATPFNVGEQVGQTLTYRIAGLSPSQEYTVNMSFYEVDVNRPGDRLMDFFLNDQLIGKDVDIFKEHGWLTEATRSAKCKADEKGEIVLKIKGKNFKAFLNGLAVTDGTGKEVWKENCGWTKFFNERVKRQAAYTPREADLRFITEPAAPSEKNLFEGHNLVINPRFNLAEEDGKPVGWYSCIEMREKSLAPYKPEQVEVFTPELAAMLLEKKNQPNTLAFWDILPGRGDYVSDTSVGHEKPGSVKITKTGKDFALVCNWPPVDFDKQQQFSFYAKTAGATGKVFGEVLWFIADMNAQDYKWRDLSHLGGPLPMPRIQLVGKDVSKVTLTGDNDWTRIDVTAKPPKGAIFALLAVRVEENTSGSVWIDDASFDGYGNEPLEIEMSLLGFHPASEKSVVFKSLTKDPVTWELQDEKGKTLRKGNATYHNSEWYSKRHYFTADFSDFKTPGIYRLVAKQGNTSVQSSEFRVDSKVYRDLARISLNGLHAMRMNQDLPGIHGPEALEDAQLPVPSGDRRFNVYEELYHSKRMDATGGYFDAGDAIKHAEFWPNVIMAASEMWKNFGKAGDKELEADALAEFKFALDSFLKVQLRDGGFVLNIKPNVEGTDNIPYYSFDRRVEDPFPAVQGAGICAQSAWELRDTDKELSARSAAAAIRNYNLNKLWEVAEKASSARQRLYAASKSLWAEIYLAKLHPEDSVYRERMGRNAELVAAGLKNGDYRGSSELYNCYNMPASLLQDPIWVACDLLKEYPDSPAAPVLREGLRSFVEEVKKVSSIDAWGQARSLEPPLEGRTLPDRIPGYWAIGYWPMLSYSLARISTALDDPDLLQLAERQMQWVLGKNFGGVAGIHGFSDRVTASGGHYFTNERFFKNWLEGKEKVYTLEGAVPKTFMRGLAFGFAARNFEQSLKQQGWLVGENYCPPFYLVPDSYCATIPQADYPVHPGIAEYGLSQMALHAIPTPLLHSLLLQKMNSKK